MDHEEGLKPGVGTRRTTLRRPTWEASHEAGRRSARPAERASILEEFAMEFMRIADSDKVVRKVFKVSLLRLLSLARSEWPLMTLGGMSMFLVVAGDACVPLLSGMATDIVARPAADTVSKLLKVMLMILTIQAAASVCKFVQVLCVTMAAERIACRVRRQLFAALVQQELAFFEGYRGGDFVTRLGRDVLLLQEGVSGCWVTAFGAIVRLTVAIVMLVLRAWQLALMVTGMVFVLACLVLPFGFVLARVSRECISAGAKCADTAQDSFESIKVVKSYGAEVFEAARYGRGIGNPDRPGFLGWWPQRDGSLYRCLILRSIATGAIESTRLATCLMGAIVWYGFRQVIQQQLTIGQLTGFLLYTAQIAAAFLELGSSLAKVTVARGAGVQIFGVIDRVPAVPHGGGGLCPEVAEGHIMFESVTFAYPSIPDCMVLKGFSLEVPAKSSTALVGPCGGGKSTLLALISRFYDVNAGSVRIDGVDITKLSPLWLRRQVAFVEQEPTVFAMTVRENICYGCAAASMNQGEVPFTAHEEVEEAAQQANAHEFISELPEGYDTPVGYAGVWLSEDQKQRVAIARALVTNPSILLLDEATSALDIESEHRVQQGIQRATQGRTVITVAHRLSTICDSNHILVVDDGQVVGKGTHHELLRSCTKYQELVRRQWGDGAVDLGLEARQRDSRTHVVEDRACPAPVERLTLLERDTSEVLFHSM